MISETEAPGFLRDVVENVNALLASGHFLLAQERLDLARAKLGSRVYDEHLTRAQIRALESVSKLLAEDRVELAAELVDCELRNSFLVPPTTQSRGSAP